MEIQNFYDRSISTPRMAATTVILIFFKQHLLQNRQLNYAKTWWEESEKHKDPKLLKSFYSDILDGRHKILKRQMLQNGTSD